MERASQLLLNPKLGPKMGGEATVAMAAWRVAVGKRLAELTYAAAFEKGTLRVYVDDKVWESQLNSLKKQILAKIQKLTVLGLVRDIEIRVMPLRRGPARETQVVRDGASRDTAGIEDPLLRRMFQRKQA